MFNVSVRRNPCTEPDENDLIFWIPRSSMPSIISIWWKFCGPVGGQKWGCPLELYITLTTLSCVTAKASDTASEREVQNYITSWLRRPRKVSRLILSTMRQSYTILVAIGWLGGGGVTRVGIFTIFTTFHFFRSSSINIQPERLDRFKSVMAQTT
jgi:hypothetical protein